MLRQLYLHCSLTSISVEVRLLLFIFNKMHQYSSYWRAHNPNLKKNRRICLMKVFHWFFTICKRGVCVCECAWVCVRVHACLSRCRWTWGGASGASCRCGSSCRSPPPRGSGPPARWAGTQTPSRCSATTPPRSGSWCSQSPLGSGGGGGGGGGGEGQMKGRRVNYFTVQHFMQLKLYACLWGYYNIYFFLWALFMDSVGKIK